MQRLLICVMAAFALPAINAQRTASLTKETDYKFTINCVANDAVFLELSMFDDFSRVRSLDLGRTTSTSRTKTLKETALPAGTYYWRIRYCPKGNRSNNEFFTPELSSSTRTLAMEGATNETQADATSTMLGYYGLLDGTSVQLYRQWVRSFNGSNNTYSSLDWPITTGSKGYYVNNITMTHGCAVSNGVIYLARGSAYTCGWDYAKNRVWLLRYDLATGREMSMLRVYAPEKADYPSADVMPWIKVDDAGTLYFTTVDYGANSRNINLYSVNLSSVSDDTDEVTAHHEAALTTPGERGPRYLTVEGRLSSGDYYVWGATDNGCASLSATTDLIGREVVRWHVKQGLCVEVDRSPLRAITNPDAMSMYMMVYPIGQSQFLLHAYSEQAVEALSPALYVFNPDSECRLIESYSDKAIYSANSSLHIGGIGRVNMFDNQFLVYGTPVSATVASSSVTIVHAPSSIAPFSRHELAWRDNLDDKGFASHSFQGCDAQWVPSTTAPGEEGQLVVWLANGGLAVYKATRFDDPDVGLRLTDASSVATAAFTDGTITLPAPIAGTLRLLTPGGRTVAQTNRHVATMQWHCGTIAPGLYLLSTNVGTLKIIVK